jgi:hypothetical protein
VGRGRDEFYNCQLSKYLYNRMTDDSQPKELVWVGSSRKEMQELPPLVRRTFGVALFAVQLAKGRQRPSR